MEEKEARSRKSSCKYHTWTYSGGWTFCSGYKVDLTTLYWNWNKKPGVVRAFVFLDAHRFSCISSNPNSSCWGRIENQFSVIQPVVIQALIFFHLFYCLWQVPVFLQFNFNLIVINFNSTVVGDEFFIYPFTGQCRVPLHIKCKQAVGCVPGWSLSGQSPP